MTVLKGAAQGAEVAQTDGFPKLTTTFALPLLLAAWAIGSGVVESGSHACQCRCKWPGQFWT